MRASTCLLAVAFPVLFTIPSVEPVFSRDNGAVSSLVPTHGTVWKQIPIQGHGALQLSVPREWRVKASRPREDLPPTIEFLPDSGEAFSVLVTVLWSPRGDPSFNSPQELLISVEHGRDLVKDSSLEADIPMREFSGERLQGLYFEVTDKESKPGEWRYMTQGSAALEDLLLTFTILTNDPNRPEAALTLEMLKNARKKQEEGVVRDRYSIRLPGKEWSVSLSIPGYKVEKEETRGDETGIMMAGSHQGRKLNLSIFLEREKRPRNAEQCRKKYFGSALSSPLDKSDVRRWEAGALALGQYLIMIGKIPGFGQMHMHAYLGEEDVCMDLHLSKVSFNEADRPLFEEVFSSVRIERESTPQPDAPRNE
jgi:hypothetical protein